MNVLIPYTIIMQDVTTGSVSSKVIHGPVDSQDALRYVTATTAEAVHVVALVRGNHPVILGLPGPA